MFRTTSRLVILASLVVAVLVAGCGGSAVRKVGSAEAVGLIANRTVIDVRTPSEFAAGHLAGAQNIDVEAADFGSRIASLDKKTAYLLYCRTGRRSAIAAKTMADAGFTDIVDAGGFDGLVAAGAQAQ